MITILTVLVAVAMLGTLGVLLAGMLGLARGQGGSMQSNRLMRWRVILQFVAVALFVVLMTLLKSSGAPGH